MVHASVRFFDESSPISFGRRRQRALPPPGVTIVLSCAYSLLLVFRIQPIPASVRWSRVHMNVCRERNLLAETILYSPHVRREPLLVAIAQKCARALQLWIEWLGINIDSVYWFVPRVSHIFRNESIKSLISAFYKKPTFSFTWIVS